MQMKNVTPDGRYFVVRGRLWRCSNPALTEQERSQLVSELMAARSAKGVAMRNGDARAREAARKAVDEAKHRLGERGEPWWSDGSPDYNRHLAWKTPYADWYRELEQARNSREVTPAKARRRAPSVARV